MWEVGYNRPDGSHAETDGHEGWLYRDFQAYEAWITEGDDTGIIDTFEFDGWGLTEAWARSLARLLGDDKPNGAEVHQSGGNVWGVRLERKDGRFVVIGADGADEYRDFLAYNTGDDPIAYHDFS